MTEKLLREEWEHLIPNKIGEQIHTFHCKQGKGNDKLYIKRLNNGSIAFCHHCLKRGFIPSTKSPARFIQKELEDYPGSNSEHGDNGGIRPQGINGQATAYGQGVRGGSGEVRLSLPADCSPYLSRWESSEPKIWLIRNGIKEQDCIDYGIYWSKSQQALVFPRYSSQDVRYIEETTPCGLGLSFFQTRGFPKSIRTYKDKNSTTCCTIGTNSTGRIFLVEDYISAVRIAKLGECAFPLMGTGLSDSQFEYLLTKADKVGIMLDNDNHQVKKAQIKLKNRFEAHGKTVHLYSLVKDPKEYNDEALKELLCQI